MKKVSVRSICFIGMFTAIISVLSILTIPTPWGVPFTLQTFAVALCGFVLGKWYGTIATSLYVLLGIIGLPVFAGLTSGPAKLVGPTGGYIYGFIVMTLFCGISMEFKKTKMKMVLSILLAIMGLAICHILGCIQLKFVAGLGFKEAAMLGTVPYLAKDLLSLICAYAIALAVRKALKSANLSLEDQIAKQV